MWRRKSLQAKQRNLAGFASRLLQKAVSFAFQTAVRPPEWRCRFRHLSPATVRIRPSIQAGRCTGVTGSRAWTRASQSRAPSGTSATRTRAWRTRTGRFPPRRRLRRLSSVRGTSSRSSPPTASGTSPPALPSRPPKHRPTLQIPEVSADILSYFNFCSERTLFMAKKAEL